MKLPQRFNMTCPRCLQDVGLFGRELKKLTRFGRRRECPHCDASLVVGYDWEKFALVAGVYMVLLVFSLGLYFVTGVTVLFYLVVLGCALVHFFSLEPAVA